MVSELKTLSNTLGTYGWNPNALVRLRQLRWPRPSATPKGLSTQEIRL
jgi:hypothetical protein